MSEHAIARHQVRRPPSALDLIAPPVAAVAVVMLIGLGTAAATPAAARGPVLVCASVAALLAGLASVVAVRNRQIARDLRGRVVSLETKVKNSTAQTERLAKEVLPLVVTRLRDGATAQAALGEAPRGTDSMHLHILRIVAEEVSRGERMRSAAMAACASAAGRMQALSTGMLADLRAMEERHSEEVLGDLLRLDHLTAQAGRLADSLAVLTGGRSGRRWTKPIVMESLLRGAMGRISDYQRVRLHSTSNVAVVGYAAEGIMHALAELMDNATSFSPPSEEVHVYVEEVQAGVVITIEDGGLVMGQAALARAEQAVSAESLDLITLSGTRLGLAVVGVLARKHGLTVSFRPSSRGGTGVIVMIPRQLITAPRSVEPPPSISDATGAATTALQAGPRSRALRALPSADAGSPRGGAAALERGSERGSERALDRGPGRGAGHELGPAPTRSRPALAAGTGAAEQPQRRRELPELATAEGSLPVREPGAFPTRPARTAAPGSPTAPGTPSATASTTAAAATVAPTAAAPTAAVPTAAVPAAGPASLPAGPEVGIGAVTAQITLPKRTRGQSMAANSRAAAAASRPRSHRARRNSIANFAAFRRAMRAASAARTGPLRTARTATDPAATTGPTAAATATPATADAPAGPDSTTLTTAERTPTTLNGTSPNGSPRFVPSPDASPVTTPPMDVAAQEAADLAEMVRAAALADRPRRAVEATRDVPAAHELPATQAASGSQAAPAAPKSAVAAEPSDAEPSDAESSDAEPSDAEPSDAEPAADAESAAEPTAKSQVPAAPEIAAGTGPTSTRSAATAREAAAASDRTAPDARTTANSGTTAETRTAAAGRTSTAGRAAGADRTPTVSRTAIGGRKTSAGRKPANGAAPTGLGPAGALGRIGPGRAAGAGVAWHDHTPTPRTRPGRAAGRGPESPAGGGADTGTDSTASDAGERAS